MLIHPQFDPVALALGPLKVHWYGLTYLAAFLLFWGLARLRLRQSPWRERVAQGQWSHQTIDDLLFYGVLGVVLGGRLGYCLFYKPDHYLAHPLEILQVWQGGMSFHGGMLGVILAMVWFAHRQGVNWLTITDFIAPCVPTGLAAGRVGNFINGELWGRLAEPSLPWAMVFPQSGDGLARHPSQIYNIGLEGVLLFILLWWFANKPRPTGQVSAMFLIGYGTVRFVEEFARQPDDFLGLLAGGLSMGQWLSLPMVLLGLIIFSTSRKKG